MSKAVFAVAVPAVLCVCYGAQGGVAAAASPERGVWLLKVQALRGCAVQRLCPDNCHGL